MFRFKLEFLRRFRMQREETAMFELAQRIREANQIEAELEEVRDRRIGLSEEALNRAESGISGLVYCLYKNHQDHLYRRGKMMEKGLALAEVRIEKQRQKLVKASVERQTIDGYRDRECEVWLEREARRELNETDELATLARARKTHED